MSPLALEVLGYLASELVVSCCMAAYAPMRAPAAFVALRFGVVAAQSAVRFGGLGGLGPGLSPLGIVLFLLVHSIALPLAFYRGGVGRRVLATALADCTVMLCEPLGLAIWQVTTGLDYLDDAAVAAHPQAYALMRSLHALALVTLFGATHLLVRDGRGRGADRTSDRLFVAFPLVQAVLLLCVFQLLYAFDVHAPSGSELLALGGAAALCVVCDGMVLVSMARAREARTAGQQVQALEGQLEKLVAQYDGVVRSVVAASRVRHDARNQLAVARALAERGDAVLARAHVAELRGQLARAEGQAETRVQDAQGGLANQTEGREQAEGGAGAC